MQLQMTLNKKLEREKERAVRWVWLKGASHVISITIDLNSAATIGYMMYQSTVGQIKQDLVILMLAMTACFFHNLQGGVAL